MTWPGWLTFWYKITSWTVTLCPLSSVVFFDFLIWPFCFTVLSQESESNLSTLLTEGQSICQHPSTPSAVMMMSVLLCLPWLLLLPPRRAEQRIELCLSEGLTESMNHCYRSCCLLPGSRQKSKLWCTVTSLDHTATQTHSFFFFFLSQ